MPRLSARDIRRLSPEAREQVRRAMRLPERTKGEASELRGEEPLPSKYHNVQTIVDGITFDSRREATRYAELKLELLAGAITDLKLQVTFSLDIDGIHICDYVADFVYQRDGQQVVEDAKGKRLELFRIKKNLMWAIHKIDVVEV